MPEATARGWVFDVRRYSIHDGPGIRTAVFLKGCPLNCLWCHNPEGIARGPELMHWPSRCVRCYSCIAACPLGAVSKDPSGAVVVDKGKCDLCGRCASACLYDAMQVVGFRAAVGDLVREIEKDRIFYEQSGGGATFTGGDPLAQPEFLEEALDALRDRGIHTAVDTSGFSLNGVLDRIAAKTGLLLYDLKLIDDARHKGFTGVSNVPILENLKRLAAGPADIWIRIPLIAGVNDDDENITGTIAFLRSLKTIRTVGLLPYHSGGMDKARRLGIDSRFRTFAAPTEERLDAIETAFRAAGFDTRRGG